LALNTLKCNHLTPLGFEGLSLLDLHKHLDVITDRRYHRLYVYTERPQKVRTLSVLFILNHLLNGLTKLKMYKVSNKMLSASVMGCKHQFQKTTPLSMPLGRLLFNSYRSLKFFDPYKIVSDSKHVVEVYKQ